MSTPTPNDLPPFSKPNKTNGLAIAGFVTSLLLCWLPLGLILSIISLTQLSKNPNQGGKPLAIAGIAIGSIGTLWFVLNFLFQFTLR